MIDVVLTWVSGKDPNWRMKFPYQYDPGRYDCEITIFESVENLKRYAKNLGTIFVVHDDCQKPEIEGVSFVSHSEIMPSSLLPCFNSYTIEAHLHNIKNLSEKFLYLNDDMVMIAETDLESLFRDDQIILGICRSITNLTVAARLYSGFSDLYLFGKWNADNLLPRKLRCLADHRCYPLTKSAIKRTVQKFNKELTASFAPIRTEKSIALLDHLVPFDNDCLTVRGRYNNFQLHH